MQIPKGRLWIDKVLVSALMLAAWVSWSRVASVFAQSRVASEYEIKAAFLYNFAKFVEWPPDGSGSGGDPMSICIIGKDPFGSVLNELIDGKTIKGRRLVIWRLSPGQDLTGCQIAFISSSERNHLHSVVESVKATGVLTVGDTEGFAALGGVINFTMVENKVHFDINVDAADRAKLKISSKLLSLARIVKDQGHGGKS